MWTVPRRNNLQRPIISDPVNFRRPNAMYMGMSPFSGATQQMIREVMSELASLPSHDVSSLSDSIELIPREKPDTSSKHSTPSELESLNISLALRDVDLTLDAMDTSLDEEEKPPHTFKVAIDWEKLEKEIKESYELPQINNLGSPGSAYTAMIVAKVNTLNLSCLLDTGAAISVASNQLRSALERINFIPGVSAAVSVSGHRLSIIGRALVDLTIANTTVRVVLHFSDDTYFCSKTGYSVILGCDVIRQFPPIVLDLGRGVMTMNGTRI
jgi:hypothetical protein